MALGAASQKLSVGARVVQLEPVQRRPRNARTFRRPPLNRYNHAMLAKSKPKAKPFLDAPMPRASKLVQPCLWASDVFRPGIITETGMRGLGKRPQGERFCALKGFGM